jgi:PilZ domain
VEDDMAPLKGWFKSRSQERRKAERQDGPEVVAHYWDGAAPAAHSIRNISTSGLYILTEQRWYPGTLVMLTLQKKDSVGEDAERSITVQSKVVRSGPDGVGLAFVPAEREEKRAAGGSTGDPDHFLTAGRKAIARFLQSIRR